MFCKMPSNVTPGDLVFFRRKSCTGVNKSHIAFVSKVENGMAYVASHNEDMLGVDIYSFLFCSSLLLLCFYRQEIHLQLCTVPLL
jgi:hypothetical protein